MRRVPVHRLIGLVRLIGQDCYMPINQRSLEKFHMVEALSGLTITSAPKIPTSSICELRKRARQHGYELIITDRSLREPLS